MDWSRAKNVLIAAFLILNLFLLFTLVTSRLDGTISREAIANTKKVLAKHGVTVADQVRIPDRMITNLYLSYEPQKLPVDRIMRELLGPAFSYGEIVYGQDYEVNGAVVHFKDDSSFVYKNGKIGHNNTIASMKDAEKYARNVINRLEIKAAEWVLDKSWEERKDGRYVLAFREKYGDYMIFGNCVYVELTAGGVQFLECRLKKPTAPRPRGRKIIPAHAILLSHYTTGQKAVITSIDLGFKGYMEDQETTQMYEYLVWRVRLDTGEESFYKASDGIRIK